MSSFAHLPDCPKGKHRNGGGYVLGAVWFRLMANLPYQALPKFDNAKFWSAISQPMGLPNFGKGLN
uniref:Uncharacterized protein n=1 Tax=Arundo donax TaxID=35708 RepID=A0A0A9BLG6_ARUDO